MSDVAVNLPSIDQIIAQQVITQPKVAPEAPAARPSMEEQAAVTEESVVETSDAVEIAEEVAVEEAAPAIEETPAKREDPMSRRFAVLSRREREIQQRQREIEAREADIQRRAQEAQAQVPTSKPKTALEALKQLGFSYQDATLEVLGQKEEVPVDPMQQRLDELSERLKKVDDLEKAQNDKWAKLESERQQALETQIRGAIRATAAQETDKYELINTVGTEAHDLVYDVMAQYYSEKQALLTYEEACDIVEQYYEERAKTLSNTRKIGQKPATTSTKPSVASKPAPVPAKASGSKTLTQRHSTTASVEPDVNSMSRDQAIAFLAKKIPMIDN